MKKAIIALILITGLVSSCKKDQIAYKGDFEKSKTAWLSFKNASANSYRYTVVFGSWTGYSTQTIISVKEGKVIERAFKSFRFSNQPPATTVLEEWLEDTGN